MFTKYTKGISIPQNYSGNRFREEAEDTKTNIHRAIAPQVSIGSTKTSVSPSFQDAIEKRMAEVSEIRNDTINEVEESEEKGDTSEKDKNVHMDAPLNSPKLNGVSQLLEKIGTDDVLLIALIVLLSSDKDGHGLDAIVILALLLLYH